MPLDALPTAIGSLPHRDLRAAVRFSVRWFPRVPFLPQRPAAGEGMLDPPALERDPPGLAALGRAIDAATAAGAPTPRLIKAQLTGPVTIARVAERTEKPPPRALIAAARTVIRRAEWLLDALDRRLGLPTILALDEPALGRDRFPTASKTAAVLGPIADRIRARSATPAVHDCGPPRPERLRGLGAVVFFFDAARYLDDVMHRRTARLALAELIERGGGIGWGIARTDGPPPGDPADLAARIRAAWSRIGDPRAVRRASLITPACGLAGLSPARARAVAACCAAVSEALRG